MKTSIVTICLALLLVTGFAQEQRPLATGKKKQQSSRQGILPDREGTDEDALKDRVRKLEQLVAALKHENQLLRAKLEERE